ncbi:hypothetical protein [Sphaerimonospora thailandensis]|uniref:Uncharacterized protein n=1 Tax=Sphaerimonospora thailandensis TaxID=795644 RepID=A0A8J3R8Z4_9ACTN|nr:hypothetical protein [Sphaerimonospora thailandensis]GIH69594.1 hypothetical protein Mth01_18470 [Sphaerimonospora thailandensis]
MGNIGAERFLPAELSLPALAGAARSCQGCDLAPDRDAAYAGFLADLRAAAAIS